MKILDREIKAIIFDLDGTEITIEVKQKEIRKDSDPRSDAADPQGLQRTGDTAYLATKRYAHRLGSMSSLQVP